MINALIVDDETIIKVDYPDITEDIIDTIIENHAGKTIETTLEHSHYPLFQ